MCPDKVHMETGQFDPLGVPWGLTMKLAIAHDWLLNRRGAERVLGDFCRAFGPLDVYTLLLDHESLAPELRCQTIYRSPLGRLPGVRSYYRLLVPWLRSAAEGLRVRDCDLLLSISHSAAKAIPRDPGIPHVCYCLTPMRYLWEPQLYESMAGSWKGLLYRTAMRVWGPGLERWDRQTAGGVDQFVAISETVRRRIRRVYGRESEVIHPGVDLEFFRPAGRAREDFYLVVSALVPQKQLETAVEAFGRNGRRLLVAGSGPWRGSLERLGGPNVHFLGWRTDEQIRDLYSRARALIFPGVEDFGLVPVEAQAMGCPVIAFAEGGATETVIEGESGYFFRRRTPEALLEVVRRLEKEPLDEERVVASGRRFSHQRFRREWREYLRTLRF